VSWAHSRALGAAAFQAFARWGDLAPVKCSLHGLVESSLVHGVLRRKFGVLVLLILCHLGVTKTCRSRAACPCLWAPRARLGRKGNHWFSLRRSWPGCRCRDPRVGLWRLRRLAGDSYFQRFSLVGGVVVGVNAGLRSGSTGWWLVGQAAEVVVRGVKSVGTVPCLALPPWGRWQMTAVWARGEGSDRACAPGDLGATPVARLTGGVRGLCRRSYRQVGGGVFVAPPSSVACERGARALFSGVQAVSLARSVGIGGGWGRVVLAAWAAGRVCIRWSLFRQGLAGSAAVRTLEMWRVRSRDVWGLL